MRKWIFVGLLFITNPAMAQFSGGGVESFSAFNIMGSVQLAVGPTSLRTALPTTGTVLWFCVSGTAVVNIKMGNDTVVATTSDFAILPSSCVAIAYRGPQIANASVPTHVAAIEVSAGQSVLYVSGGTGHP